MVRVFVASCPHVHILTKLPVLTCGRCIYLTVSNQLLAIYFLTNSQVNGMLLAGQKVYVGPFLKKSDRPADKESRFTNVYVKNLPDSVDDQKLNEMFSEHGSVTSAVVMKVPSACTFLFPATACCQPCIIC